MKLTQENIKFIDNYLKNSQIDFFDIRMEMLDHISSAVEEKMQLENLDFYDAFKNYMVLNKKELIKRNENLMKWSFSNALPFLKFCVKPFSLILALCFFIIYKFNQEYFTNVTRNAIYLAIIIIIISIFLIQFFVYRVLLKDRLYVVEKSGFILIFIYHFSQFFYYFFNNKNILYLFFYIISLVTFLYLLFYLKQVNKHRKFYLK